MLHELSVTAAALNQAIRFSDLFYLVGISFANRTPAFIYQPDIIDEEGD